MRKARTHESPTVADGVGPATASAWAPVNPSRAASVLVIEGDGIFRRVLRKVLEANGFAVIDVADGRAGLDLYRRCRPALVITDVLMPDLDGIEILLAIRRENPTATVIAMSGCHSAGLDYLHLAKQFGASDVLRKPFNADELAVVVSRCIAPLCKHNH